MKRFHFLILFLMVSCSSLFAQDVFGNWTTVDDEDNREKGVVTIYEESGSLYGKLIDVFPLPNEPKDPLCTECKGDQKDKPMRGLVIITDMKLASDGKSYEGGIILDPEDGKEYKCKLWREGDELKVRGYWGFFYRTQTWKLRG